MYISQGPSGKVALEVQEILKNLQNNYQVAHTSLNPLSFSRTTTTDRATG